MPSNEEYETALNNLDKHNWEVDYVITHCAPDSTQRQITYWYEHDKLTNFLEVVDSDLKYKHWYFGHYHVDKQIDGKHTAVYDNIIKLQ